MIRKVIFLLVLLVVAGCSGQAPPAVEENENGEQPNATFWELKDDSELSVEITPWPPTGGATLVAHAGLGDHGGTKPIVDSLEYRVSPTAESSTSWTPMARESKTRNDDDGSFTEYEFSAKGVALPSGKVFVQFRAKGEGLDQQLTDWAVTVP